MRYEFRENTSTNCLQLTAREYQSGPSAQRRRGESNSCRQLARWIDQLDSETRDLENSIEDIDRLIGNLRDSRTDNAINAATGAASAAAGPLASALRGARLVRRLLSGGGANLADIVSTVPVIGGAILAARSALAVARDPVKFEKP